MAGGAAVAMLLALTVIADALAQLQTTNERTERYERTGAPLALVDGDDLSAPAPGWELVSVSDGWSPDDVTITYGPEGRDYSTAWVELRMERDPGPSRRGTLSQSCERSIRSMPSPSPQPRRIGTDRLISEPADRRPEAHRCGVPKPGAAVEVNDTESPAA